MRCSVQRKPYIVGVIEAAETDEAGRRFRERKAQERADEHEI